MQSDWAPPGARAMAAGMDAQLAIIGFGEAGRAFAPQLAVRARAYDRQTDEAAAPAHASAPAAAMHAHYRDAGVVGCDTAADALAGAGAVLSLVTADQALAAARACAPLLAPGALWFDMNSVAPDTKREAARAIAAAGAHAVDVAVMAPVLPSRAAVPLLVSGAHAAEGAALLRRIGFGAVRIVPGDVGAASAIKMIRSVMVKGIEALTAECVLAADAAGVLDEVLASLDASPPPPGWAPRADYNLDRMMRHGLRRAAEMEEVAKTLDALGTGAQMARATIERQRAIGRLGIAPPAGLAPKLAALRPRHEARAA